MYAVPHPITAQCTHCNPRCALPCAGALQQPLPTPTYRGGVYLGTIPGYPHPYLLPTADRHHAIPLHLVEHLAVGPSPFQKRPPRTPSDARPPDEPPHATPGPRRAIPLLTLKAEATIPRDLEGKNHLMVEGLTEHVLIAAMYATASASRLWEDRPSPPLARAAEDARDTGPTAEDIHRILGRRAPPKTHPQVRPIQLVSWDTLDAPPATTEVHILKHRETWWTVEWDDHRKVRRAAAHAPDDKVPPRPRGVNRLRLAARVPHTPEAAWEALHYALYWAQGAPEGPLPPERTPAWTRHATRYTAHMRHHGAGIGHRLLTWPTDPPDALREAKEVLGLMTKQLFQLKDTVPMSKPGVPAAREHPVFAPGHAPVQQPQGAPPQRGQPNARRRQGAKKRKAPAQAKPAPKPRAKSKSWTEDEAAALYPEYVIPIWVQPPFKYATAAGPSKWIWAAGEVKHQYRVTGEHQVLKIHVKWDPAAPNHKKVGRTVELWKTETVVRWSPCSYAPRTRSTSPAPSTRAKSTVHGPYPSPRSGTTRHPQLRASSTSSKPDGARTEHGPSPQLPVPRNRRLRKPTPASTSSTSPWSRTTPPRLPHCNLCRGHTPKAQTSWVSWSKPSAERTSPNRHRSWTQRGTNITPTGNRGVPLYHKTSVTVHAHPNLGVDCRLGAYECVGPGWQLNVLHTHVPFGEETRDFLDTLSLAYRPLSLLAPTIIIGDLNAAPTDDDRNGPPGASDIAVRNAMHQLGFTHLTTGLTGTPSHYPYKLATTPPALTRATGTQPWCASTRQPMGTSLPRARATDPSTSTS